MVGRCKYKLNRSVGKIDTDGEDGIIGKVLTMVAYSGVAIGCKPIEKTTGHFYVIGSLKLYVILGHSIHNFEIFHTKYTWLCIFKKSNAPLQAFLTILRYKHLMGPTWDPTNYGKGGSNDPSGTNLDNKLEINLIPLTHSSMVY